MKFTVSKNLLLEAVLKSSLVARERTTLPVTNSLLLEALTDVLKITGSNIDSAISTYVAADIKKSGALCLPAKKLIAWLSLVKQPEVKFELKDNRCQIECGTKTMFAFIAADEFPSMKPASGQTIELPCADLHKKLKNVKHAMHDDETDEFDTKLCSVAFLFDPGLTLIATNRKRIAIESIDIEGQGCFIVPAHLIEHLINLTAKSEGNATINLSESFINITTESWTLCGKLREGKYPISRKVFESAYAFENSLTLNREHLINQIQQCKLFVEHPQLSPIMRWECEGKTLMISGGAAEDSFESEPLACAGFEFRISLPPDNILDALNVLECQEVKIEATDKNTPIRIIEGTFQSLIMPLRSE